MTIDHTLSWEVARVGGMLAYLLLSGSVVLGLLLSLGAASQAWPRFITNELHRFVTLVALVFMLIHSAAVFLDPFTGFTPAEVLVPFTAHYRPLWIAIGIASTYLMVAVWASEYVRSRVGYAWWRRFHYLSFAAFVLATLHGLGTGSDSGEPWAIAIYGVAGGLVTILVAWRFVRALPHRGGDVGVFVSGASFIALFTFALLGPAKPGWNAIANNGNGNGASAAWLASQSTVVPSVPPSATFVADLVASVVGEDRLQGTFDGGTPDTNGSFAVVIDDGSAMLELDFGDGWLCQGSAAITGPGALRSTCVDPEGVHVDVTLSDLRRQGEGLVGTLRVDPPSG